MSFTFIDLFAGIGGFRVALERLGGQCIYSCEVDEKCEFTYQKNFGDTFSHKDISSINEKKIPKADIVCAGFPCQPFSIAGKKGGFNDPRSKVFFDLMRVVKATKPSIVFIENVSNLTKHNHGKSFDIIINELKLIGYESFFKTLDAKSFGVPQSRKRVYIVAILKDVTHGEFQFSIPNNKVKTVREILISGDYSIPITEKWEDYIDLYTGEKNISELNFNVPKTRKEIERKDPLTNLHDCVFQIRSSGIRALSLDKPFPTFAVSVSGGGALIPVLSKERRHLSVREIARIMGYDDTYTFPVARTHAIKQLSNSVCPPVIESIGKDILKYLSSK